MLAVVTALTLICGLPKSVKLDRASEGMPKNIYIKAEELAYTVAVPEIPFVKVVSQDLSFMAKTEEGRLWRPLEVLRNFPKAKSHTRILVGTSVFEPGSESLPLIRAQVQGEEAMDIVEYQCAIE